MALPSGCEESGVGKAAASRRTPKRGTIYRALRETRSACAFGSDDGAVARWLGFRGGQGHVGDVLAAGDGEEIGQGLFGLGFAARIGENEMQ